MIGAVCTELTPGKAASSPVRYAYRCRVSRKTALATRFVGPVVAAANGISGCAAGSTSCAGPACCTSR